MRVDCLYLCLFFVMGVFAIQPAAGQDQRGLGTTFVVTSTADIDDGQCADHCTLREALNSANDTLGADFISFEGLPVDQPIITLTDPMDLPAITEALTIDGSTHPNGRVQLKTDPGATANGIGIVADDVTVKGLVFSGPDTAIVIANADRTTIQGCYFNTNLDGTTFDGPLLPKYAIQNNRSNATLIGGPMPEDRNLFTSTNDGTIFIDGGADVTIQGNFFNLQANGADLLQNVPDNLFGRLIETSDARDNVTNLLIGGAQPGEGNVAIPLDGDAFVLRDSTETVVGNIIGLNSQQQLVEEDLMNKGIVDGDVIGGFEPGSANIIGGLSIAVESPREMIGNLIGTNENGDDLGNLFGVLTDLSNTLIGNPQLPNTIAFNTVGISVETPLFAMEDTTGVNFADNIFRNNTTQVRLGAMLTPNDPGDGDEGVNRLQNHPFVSDAQLNGANLDITYSLDTDPLNAAYPLFVNLYLDDDETGAVPIGTDVFTEQDFPNGFKTTNFGPLFDISANAGITTIATDSMGNSSIFSNEVSIIDNNPPDTPIFSDGFESGDVSAWSSNPPRGASLIVDAAFAFSGQFGLGVQAGAQGVLINETPNTVSLYFARFYLMTNGLSIGDDFGLFAIYNESNQELARLGLQPTGDQVRIFVEIDGVVTPGRTLPRRWTEIELLWNADAGQFDVLVDRSLSLSQRTQNLSGDLDIASIHLGDLDGVGSGALAVDDFDSRTGRTTPLPCPGPDAVLALLPAWPNDSILNLVRQINRNCDAD